jgi:predicted transcriptional regulator of viral defense system
MDTQSINAASGLGEKAASLLMTLAGQGKRIFETHEAHAILGGSRPATYKLLHDLAQKGWLQPLSKGQYLIIPLEAGPERRYTVHEFLIAHHLAPTGYIAYWTALHHHGLTEQIPRTVWVAVAKRHSTTTISGVTYRFVTLQPYKMFGQQPLWLDGQPVPVADLHKSLVDALDHPEHCGGSGEVAKALFAAWTEQDVDLERLTGYAQRMRNGAILKRLGYLAERLSLPVEDFVARWQDALSKGYARLDPARPAQGAFSSRWRIQVNLPAAELTGWMES